MSASQHQQAELAAKDVLAMKRRWPWSDYYCQHVNSDGTLIYWWYSQNDEIYFRRALHLRGAVWREEPPDDSGPPPYWMIPF
jgi:hypothetical protein